LASTGSKRSKVAPELPTLAEQGFPGFDVSSWYALLVPAKTPMTIVNRLHAEAIKAVGLPTYNRQCHGRDSSRKPAHPKNSRLASPLNPRMGAGDQGGGNQGGVAMACCNRGVE
jgi:hypothetical protein